ncbi:MAG: OmpA family protein, partial [Bacteroidales bacterium]
MRKINFRILFIILIFFIRENAFSNIKESGFKRDTVQLFFQFDNSDLYKSYRSNREQMRKLDSLILRNDRNLDSITICSFASVEGDEHYNKRLSLARSSSVKNYLSINHPAITQKIPVHNYAGGEDWDGLLDQAYERKWIPDREALITILEDSLLLQSEKKNRIYTLRNGEVFDYLNEYVFWRSRNTSSIILCYKKPLQQIAAGSDQMIPVS